MRTIQETQESVVAETIATPEINAESYLKAHVYIVQRPPAIPQRNATLLSANKWVALPVGWQWCTVHKKGIHYEHKCRRHGPHFPPVPKIAPTAAACIPCPDQLTDRVLTMLGISDQQPQPLQQQHSSQRKRNPIKITPPSHRLQNFRTARDVSTNVATQGPQVNNILASILQMDSSQREVLSEGLSKAGF